VIGIAVKFIFGMGRQNPSNLEMAHRVTKLVIVAGVFRALYQERHPVIKAR
jgi:hypothetical protein